MRNVCVCTHTSITVHGTEYVKLLIQKYKLMCIINYHVLIWFGTLGQSPLRDRSPVIGVKQSTRFIYLFLAYLRTFRIAKVIQRQMTRWCMNRRNGKYESILGIILGISLSLVLVDGKTAWVTTACLRTVICKMTPTKYAVLPTDSDVRLLHKKESSFNPVHVHDTTHATLSIVPFLLCCFKLIYLMNKPLTRYICTVRTALSWLFVYALFTVPLEGTTCIHIRTMNNSMITNIRHVKVVI